MAASEIIHSAGRRWTNQILNGSVSRPANLFLLLRQLDGVGGHPPDAAAADTLTSSLAEVSTSGTGYGRISIAFNATNFPEAANGADSDITVAQQTFTFTGTVTGITHAALATTTDNTGVLLASAPLSVTRNVANGDQIKETFIWKQVQG